MNLANTKKTASLSTCGRYRWTLTRTWDDRPVLLVCMFNPSDADANQDDPTIRLVCQVAAHNGFGGIVVVNAVPLRCPKPADAIAMVNGWEAARDWQMRDLLQQNLAVIINEVEHAGAILLGWGALGENCENWMCNVLDGINNARAAGVPVYCLGKTAGGFPKHPMALGKHKVRKDALLVPWDVKK